MAQLIPDVPVTSERFRKSPGEAAIYAAMRNLPDPIVVIHGLATLTRHEGEDEPEEGELDFVVLDPSRGLLVVEAKGGEVQYDSSTDVWHLVMGRSRKRRITDPGLRAANRLRDLRKKLSDVPGWSALGLNKTPGGHAVIFSGLDDVEQVIRPNLPQEIYAGRTVLNDLSAWLDGVYRYHGATTAPGTAWLEHAKQVLARSFEVRPRLGVTVAQDTKLFDYWTDQQWQALHGMRYSRKLGVMGAAGTGKTLLAVRRAQELALAGEQTLLLCFNALLGDHLKRERELFLQSHPEAGAKLWVMTYHELCKWWVDEVGARTKRDFLAEARRIAPGQDTTHVVRPVALALAIEHERPNCQALVIDEAQDFRRAYWTSLAPLLEVPSIRLLVFYDMNQRLFSRAQGLPVDLETSYVLTKNCRSGRAIHEAIYQHYDGPEIAPNECDGEIQRWEQPDLDQAADYLLAQLLDMVVKHKVPPEDIVVLLLDAREREACETALSNRLKDRRLKLSYSIHFERAQGHVRMDTVGRFKGMEAAVVILWAQGWPDDEVDRSFLYVGLSRARSLLAVLGPPELVERTLRARRQT